jgi:hypothetical protein
VKRSGTVYECLNELERRGLSRSIPIRVHLIFLVLLLLLATPDLFSQTAASITVTTTKSSVIFGEPVKLTARVRDSFGNPLPLAPITWTVEPSSAATIAADGTVTARQLTVVIFRAVSGSVRSEISIQFLPKRIVVTPQRDTMTVGSTQIIRAEAMDVNDRSIAGTVFRWTMTNLLRGWNNDNPMATIDGGGQMRALVQGQVWIDAVIAYASPIPAFVNQVRGETVVEMRAPQTYNFTRVFAAEPVQATSQLSPRLSQLVPTETDGFIFGASLDATGLALLKWQDGSLQTLLTSGRPHIQTGLPLVDILAYTTNHNGDVLTNELDSSGNTELSRGPAQAQTPLLVPGTPLYIADRTNRFDIQRNSLSDSGINVVQVNYTEAETLRAATGLFRGDGRGLSEKIVSTLDRLPGYPNDPFLFRYYGVTADGTAWFVTTIGLDNSKYVLWKQKPYGPIERMLGDGDSFQGSPVRFVGNTAPAGLFVASNGEVVASVQTAPASYFARWVGDDPTPQVLRTGTNNLWWHEPGVGTLITSNISNRGVGLYLWNNGDPRPLLLVNSTLNGSHVTEIQSAVANSHGVIFAMVTTVDNPMVIVRLQPDVQIVLKAYDNIPVSVPPVISTIVRGRRPGLPVVITGSQTGTIATITENGKLAPILSVGDALPGGKIFRGSNGNQVRTVQTGEIVFADTNGLYMWRNGTSTLLVPNPSTVEGVQIAAANAIEVNSGGAMAIWFGGTGSGIYLMSGGNLTKVLRLGETFNGGVVTTFRPPAIDDTGRIAFWVVTDKGESLAIWSQGFLSSVFADGSTMPDGRVARSHDGNVLGSNDGFVIKVTMTDDSTLLLRYRSAFEYVVRRDERTPTGSFVLFAGAWAANRTGSVAFFYGGGNALNHLIAKRGDTIYEVQDWDEPTADGDLLVTSITALTMADDATVFALTVDDSGQQLIYQGSPILGSIETSFSVRSFGGVSLTTSGTSPVLTSGYARVDSNSLLPALAIFGYRQNGVLVSEAAVPASAPITSGRFFAEIGSAVNTGLAIANPNDDGATISYRFVRTDGSEFRSGVMTLGGNQQRALFLDQSPFDGGSDFIGSFSFTSTVGVSVIALRGYTNARGEFLITTLPVVNLSQAPSTTASTIPHFATGGGWTTQILLVNPTEFPLAGSLQFYSPGSANSAGVPVNVTVGGRTGNSFSYSIAPGSSTKLVLTGDAVASGSVRVIPQAGAVPSALAVFSFASDNVVVSEAGAAGVSGTAMQMYAESSGVPFTIGSIQSGVAIANPSSAPVSVTLEVRNLDASPTGTSPITITIPANGQTGKFLNEYFPTLATPFQGVLRVTAASPVSAVGLRGRTNERNHFLITTTPPSPISQTAAPLTQILPHLVDGGGYTTQIIVIGNGAGDFGGTLRYFTRNGLPLPLNLR